MEPGSQWAFAPFCLHPNGQMLWHNKRPVAVPPRAFAVLCYLVEHAGALVTKDELLDAVWQHRFVSESVLKGCINELRKTLDDDAKSPRYIETVPRRGYRFIAAPKRVALTATTPQTTPPLTTTIGVVPRATDQKKYLLPRSELLARLQQVLARSLVGVRQVVFVTGEAGIGKTTLVETFLEPMASRGIGVLWGRCIDQYGPGEAFLPLLEVLDRACRATGGAGLIARLQQWAPTWLVQMPGLMDTQAYGALQKEIAGATQERMLRELAGVLENISQDLPLVLVLEDLHWSDMATLDAILLLAQRRDAARLLVIGTYRPVDASLAEHPIKRLRQDLLARGCCSDLPLTPFSPMELRRYLSVRFACAAVPEVFVDKVHGRTEGHPLFVADLIDDWTARGLIKPVEKHWKFAEWVDEFTLGVPARLRVLIEQRIAALGEKAQRLLAVASAAGEEWPTALVAAALEMDCDAADECCESLAEHGQLIAQVEITEWPDGTVCGRYRFLHALYQEVLYQQLGEVQRIRIHKRLAERLAAAYSEQSHPVAAVLADHFERGRDYALAVRYLEQAAENAARRFANQEAETYLSRALTLVESLPAPEQIDTRIALLQRRAHVRSVVDELDSAIEDLKLVLRSGRDRNDQALIVKTLVQISRLARWFDSSYCLEVAAEAETMSRELSDELINACASVNYARAKLNFAMLNSTGWGLDSVAICRKGLGVIRGARDPNLLAQFLGHYGWMECMSSNYMLARHFAEECARIAKEVRESFYYMASRWLQCWITIYLGRFGEVLSSATDALSVSEKNGNYSWIMNDRLLLARLHAEALDF